MPYHDSMHMHGFVFNAINKIYVVVYGTTEVLFYRTSKKRDVKLFPVNYLKIPRVPTCARPVPALPDEK